MPGDPHTTGGPVGPVIPDLDPVADAHVFHVSEVGMPLEAGTVEALLAQGPVVGASDSIVATFFPWEHSQPGDEDVDGVEVSEGP